MSPSLSVLQVADSLAVEFGGTAAACAQLVTHLSRSGVHGSVLTCAAADSGSAWTLDPDIPTKNCRPAPPLRFGYCPGFRDAAMALPRPEVVHVHGLWRLHYWQAAQYAREVSAPLVVSLHGMLYREALRERAVLKQLARRAYQDDVLRGAACLHATAAEEVVELRRLGFTAPAALIPWGVDIPNNNQAADRSAPMPRNGRRTVLYFGRLHPRKGLGVLLDAWSRLGPHDRRRLVIAGSDADGYRSTLMAHASDLGVSASVEWAGVLSGGDRERMFDEASVLVLPSAYENFGLVIAEALARGIPAIATEGSPWASLVDERCGWWIRPDVDSLASALADALGRSDAELTAMGERGRRFVAARFRWECAAGAMRELYEWLLGRRPQPAFVSV